ncbi:hypothetical protein L1987_67244 [Smallanthus sonchifolius]|uniref:Uncharacterized protein n=1 Tax=Smallanthus sonchifolius TaxID=185202 RepID=A0ACB9BZL3_9ASTR|nr:hypothetical protein L1987_67244 [Smallanthus sonchifolius]
MKNTTVSVDTCKQVAGPSYSNVVGSGFNFARAVQGAKVKPVKPPIQQPLSSSQTPGPGLPRFAVLNSISELDPFDQSSGTGTTFSELDIHASIKRTSLVEASSDLYPPDPMNEDGSTAGRFLSDDKDDAAGKGATEKEKLFCQVNREHVEGARLLPNSVLSSPSPGGIHSSNGGKSYGITESQRKAIADRISASSNICIDETVNWCPGEWDYFNDLCISLGLDPDYCIEDVESDTENGTAQFLSGLLKEGCPKSNRKRVSVSRYGDWDSLVAILIWYIRMRFWPLVYARFTIVFWPIMVMAIRMEIRNFGLGANFLVGFIFPGFWACVGALLTYPQYFDFSSWEFRPKFWCPAQFEGPMHGFVFDTCNILFYLLIRKNRLKVGPMGVFFNGHYLKGYWAWSWALQPIVQLKVLPPLEFQPKARISAQIEGPNRGVDIGTYNNLLYLNFLYGICLSFGVMKPSRIQPPRNARLGRGSGGPSPVKGWNPFGKKTSPVVSRVKPQQECLVNRSASTVPIVSPSSTSDSSVERTGFTSSVTGFNWSDIVKGLSRGSQSDSVHVPPVTPASSPPLGGGGLFNSRFSSCLVTPLHLPVSVSGSDSTISVGVSQVAAVMHDVPSSDISVTAGCMRENPTGDPISCGSGVIGVSSCPVISSPDLDSVFPVVSESADVTSPVGDLLQDVASPKSAGVGVTAGCTAGNPTGPTLSVGLPEVGPVNAGLHYSEFIGPISSGPAGPVSDLGTDTTGPIFSTGPPLAKTGPDGKSVMDLGARHGPILGLGSDQSVAPFVVPKEISVPKGPSVVVSTVEPASHVDDGFVAVKGKKWRKKKPNTSGPGVMTSGLDVSSVPVGPVSLGPKEDEVVVTQVSVAYVAAPLPLPKGNLRDKGKIPVSNQFASLGGPVLEDFDDYFDGVTGLWESERQTAHYYIEYGFKPPDFVFESWSPKLKAYFSQLTEVDSTDPGGPSQVIEEDVEVPPDELLLG